MGDVKECPHTSTGFPPFTKRAECSEPGYEYEWDRVQRERKEGDPKYLGKFFRSHVVKRMTSLEYARDFYRDRVR